jgi:hypothetical protein
LTPLPKDISPFDKSASKGRDVQGDLRKLATVALGKALSEPEPPKLLELEFPPLIGGEQSKTQFDDFDSKSSRLVAMGSRRVCMFVVKARMDSGDPKSYR